MHLFKANRFKALTYIYQYTYIQTKYILIKTLNANIGAKYSAAYMVYVGNKRVCLRK